MIPTSPSPGIPGTASSGKPAPPPGMTITATTNPGPTVGPTAPTVPFVPKLGSSDDPKTLKTVTDRIYYFIQQDIWWNIVEKTNIVVSKIRSWF